MNTRDFSIHGLWPCLIDENFENFLSFYLVSDQSILIAKLSNILSMSLAPTTIIELFIIRHFWGARDARTIFRADVISALI